MIRGPGKRAGIGCWLLALCLTTSACGRAPGERLAEDYPGRLAQAGGMERPAADPFPLSVYPGQRELVLELPDLRVGFGGLFDYRRCDMMQLISERNSLLGKVMPISQRLIYELRFLRRAETCRAELAESGEADADFMARLDEVIGIKRASLAAVFWNASFASPELARAHSLAVAPLEPGRDNGFEASLQALDYFRELAERLDDPALSIDSATLEGRYQVLQADQYGGRLLVTLALLAGMLERASAILDAMLERSEGCPAETFEAVRELHRERVRPYVEQVHERGRSWFDTLAALLDRQAVTPPPAFADYYRDMLSPSDGDGLWQHFTRARQAHERNWQRLEQRCDPDGQQGEK